MKRFLLGLLLCLFTVLSVHAQHSVGFSYTASTTTGVAGYNIYRAPCNGVINSSGVCTAEGTFAKIGSNTSSTLTYTDTTVTAGGSYAYYVTVFCPPTNCSSTVGGESKPSNHIAAVVPLDQPQPPTGLTLGTVARYVLPNGNTLAAANYEDVPNLLTNWSFSSHGKLLGKGVLVNQSGTYLVMWQGKINKGQPITFTACDIDGNCRSKNL